MVHVRTRQTPSIEALVIAAGRGSRLGDLTSERPKCLLALGRSTILGTIKTGLTNVGATSITGVVGYRSELLVPFFDAVVVNERWSDSNVLGSFLAARKLLAACAASSTSLVVTYSDIAVDDHFFEPLLSTGGDVVLLCDFGWRCRYAGRTAHPISEAELVRSADDRYVDGGKYQAASSDGAAAESTLAEFTGAFKLSPRGCRRILDLADALVLSRSAGAGGTSYLRTAYLTDLFNAAVAAGEVIVLARTSSWWQEVDTSQDLERARQYLV